MKRPVEMPPILSGDEQHQIQQQRDYLIRLAQQLNEEEQSVTFIPEVDEAGNLSWSNNGGLENPTPCNIRGPAGRSGSSVDPDVQALINAVYPVGSIYMSTNSTSPATLFNVGTWVRIKDRFLLSAGDTYDAGDTGGEAENSHSHKYGLVYGAYYRNLSIENNTNAGLIDYDSSNNESLSTQTSIASAASVTNNNTATSTKNVSSMGHYRHSANASYTTVNNMPPYLAVYVWQRTA